MIKLKQAIDFFLAGRTAEGTGGKYLKDFPGGLLAAIGGLWICEEDAGVGTDFYAIRNGYVSISPIQVDLTRHSQISVLGDWVRNLDV